MLRKPDRAPTVDNVGDVTREQTNGLRVAALFPVTPEGNVLRPSTGLFLLNPSSYEESKSANWVQQVTPGQSDPPLQWLNSGARTVRFQALVTADNSDFVAGSNRIPGEESDENGFLGRIFSGSIASAFARTATPSTRVSANDSSSATALDISNYLNYYRSLLYPVFDNIENPRNLRQSPPLVVLMSGSAINKFQIGDRISSQSDVFVVTNLRIRVTKQLPNLAPLEAEVDFELVQYNIRSFSRDRFLVRGT